MKTSGTMTRTIDERVNGDATRQTTALLLEQVARIAPHIREHAASAEEDRRLSSAVYDAMYDAGLFGMMAPRAYGGLELHPVGAMQVWEAVARVDPSAAWNLVMNQAVAASLAWLPAESVREVLHDGPTTI